MDMPLFPLVMLALGLVMLIWVYFPALQSAFTRQSADAMPIDRSVKLDKSTNSGLINTGDIQINKRFEVDETLISSLDSQMDKSRPVVVVPYGSSPRTAKLAKKLEEKLVASGFTISGQKMSAGFISHMELDSPITVCPNGYSNNGITIMGGQQLVLIDASIQP